MERPRKPPRLALFAAAVSVLAAGLAPGEETRAVRVTKADCARLVKHQPAPDVRYRPGVDIRGDPLAPADLYGGVRLDLPETVTIPIEVDLFDRLGLPPDQRYDGDVQVGVVTLDLTDGRASFNGQPLTPAEQDDLARKCGRVLRAGEN